MLPIKGFIPNSLIEWSGKISAVIFLANCNFRCPFCQNPELIEGSEKIPNLPEYEILKKLEAQKKWIDGVSITGGEPLVHAQLPEFIAKIKKMGLFVKIYTNGSNAKMMKELIDKKLIDAVTMDIKGPIEKYDEIVGVNVNKEDIKQSVELIRASGLEYTFVTTVLPKFFTKEDAVAIGEWLKGSKKYCIHQFRSEKTLDANFANEKKYTHEQLHELADAMRQYFEVVEIRGI